MKKLSLLLLSLLALGHSFVMADTILDAQDIEYNKNKFEQEKKRCEDTFGTMEEIHYRYYECIYNYNNPKNLIIVQICLAIAGGTILYLTKRKTHTDDKPIS